MGSLLWFILRPFYIFGLIFVAPTFVIFLISGISEEPEIGIPVVIFSLLYFVLGYVWFGVIPKKLNARLSKRIQANKGREFTPLAQATALLYNRAIALDPQHRKLLYIDMQKGTEEILDYEDIRGWELVRHGNKPASLTLATDSPSHPTIGLNLPQNQVDNFSVWLRTLKP